MILLLKIASKRERGKAKTTANLEHEGFSETCHILIETDL